MRHLRGFTLIELVISVALLLIAISIALFAVVGTNGMIQKADARSSISESTRSVGDEIRRATDNAPVGGISLLSDQGTKVAIQVKAFSNLQSGNTCTIIGRASVSPDPNATGEEKYKIIKDGTLIAVLIYNIDSGGGCPSLSTDPIYQNRLTNTQAVVKDAQFSLQNIPCTVVTATCITKQLLRYSLTLEMAQKGSGGTSEARQPTLTIQEGLSIGLVNEAITTLKIDTTSLPAAHAGTPPYSANVVVSGGMPNYTWALDDDSGPLPAGLTLHSTTGVIDGTPNPPTAGHTFPIIIKVTDSDIPNSTATRELSIIVIDDQIAITTTSPLPDATEGVNYSPGTQLPGGQLKADRGVDPAMSCSCTWTIKSGNLPNGMSMSSGGKISGTPTAAGDYSMLIRAAESSNLTNYAEKTFLLNVLPSGQGQTLSITTISLPGGTVASGYTQGVTATGGTGSYTWSLFSGTLPPGLTLSSSGTPTTTISGTPTTAGTYNFVLKVVDGVGGSDTQSLTIIISDGGGSE
ncbi:MAG: putative Ig domain-containing protein [Candidatus Berkelbacteria bacterium]|nr:putative Ig domain-containing protein [Candidatus Berkelbacteria bacterium]